MSMVCREDGLPGGQARYRTFPSPSRRAVAPLLLLAVAVLGTSCKGDSMGPIFGEDPVPTTVLVEPGSYAVQSIGEEVEFSARVLDARGEPMSDVAVHWETANPAVLEVVRPGVFRSGGVGSAVVRAIVPNGPMGEAIVQVSQVPTQLTLSAETVRLWALGQQRQLEVEVVDALGTPLLETPVIVWSTEEEAVATVSAGGEVVAVGDGTTRIVARLQESEGVRAEVQVEVSAAMTYTTCLTFSAGSGSGNGEPLCFTLNLVARK